MQTELPVSSVCDNGPGGGTPALVAEKQQTEALNPKLQADSDPSAAPIVPREVEEGGSANLGAKSTRTPVGTKSTRMSSLNILSTSRAAELSHSVYHAAHAVAHTPSATASITQITKSLTSMWVNEALDANKQVVWMNHTFEEFELERSVWSAPIVMFLAPIGKAGRF